MIYYGRWDWWWWTSERSSMGYEACGHMTRTQPVWGSLQPHYRLVAQFQCFAQIQSSCFDGSFVNSLVFFINVVRSLCCKKFSFWFHDTYVGFGFNWKKQLKSFHLSSVAALSSLALWWREFRVYPWNTGHKIGIHQWQEARLICTWKKKKFFFLKSHSRGEKNWSIWFCDI